MRAFEMVRASLVVGSAMLSIVAFSQTRRHMKALPVDEAPPAALPIVQSPLYIIVKPEWDEADEAEFSQFVAAIGASNCTSILDCLKSEANIFRDSDPPSLTLFADCADFPIMLRAYFAWKRGLPFSVASAVKSNDPPRPEGMPPLDYRYTTLGNQIAARRSFAAKEVRDDQGNVIGGSHMTINDMGDMVHNVVSSAIYRTDPRQENPTNFSDFYPAALERGVIRPGTVLYAPHGHSAIVSNVAKNGDIQVLQAGIDGIISRIVFNKSSFPQSRTEQGAGFKNFRPQRLVGSFIKKVGPPGSQMDVHIGGSIQAKTDEELRAEGKYSLDQYRDQGGKYDHNGQKLAWDEYVTARLSGVKWVRDPIRDFNKRLVALCSQAQARMKSVDLAFERGLPRETHPEKLPTNIFGADQPDWETFSSPGRDANMREMMSDMVEYAKELSAMSAVDLKRTAYQGNDIRGDLSREFQRQNRECILSYNNSNGKKVNLTINDLMNRAEKISFDPYHCPELRWGAEGSELQSCVQGDGSMEWYVVLAPLRKQKSRDTGGFYGYTLEEAQKAFRKMDIPKAKFDFASLF